MLYERDLFAGFENTVLDNGLRIYSKQQSNFSFQRFGFGVLSGAEDDPPYPYGTAHFVEHLLTANVSFSYEDLKKFFYQNGGEFNLGATYWDRTFYGFAVPSSLPIIRKALKYFGEMLLGADLSKRIEEERKIIKSEFEQAFPYPQAYKNAVKMSRDYLGDLWNSGRLSPLGDPESINHITVDDLRNFYSENYQPNNMVIVATGLLNHQRLVEVIEKTVFGKTPLRATVQKFTREIGLPSLKNPLIRLSYSRDLQMERNAGSTNFNVLVPDDIGSANRGLFKNIFNDLAEEKIRSQNSLSYSVNVNWHYRPRFYDLAIYCDGIETENLNMVASLIKDTIAETISVTKDNLERFKQHKRRMIKRLMMQEEDSRYIVGEAINLISRYGQIITDQNYLNNLREITFKQYLEIAPWFEPARWRIIITEP